MSRFRIKPALRPKNARIRVEGLSDEESGKIEANIHTPRYEETVQSVALGGSDSFAEIRDRWKYSQAFCNACLEIGKLADFVFERGTRQRIVGNVSVNLALQTAVDEGVCDDVEEDGANGCGRCVGASKAIGT